MVIFNSYVAVYQRVSIYLFIYNIYIYIYRYTIGRGYHGNMTGISWGYDFRGDDGEMEGSVSS